MKKAWIAFAVTLAVVLPLRIYAMTGLFDSKTGFYTDGGRWIAVVSIILILGIVATAFFSSGKGKEKMPVMPVRNAGVGALAALGGIFLLIQSVVGLVSGYGGDNKAIYIIVSLVGIPAGGAVMTAAYDFASGETTLRKHPLFALIPSVWGCLLLVYLFVTYAAMINLVENVYTTFTVVFLLLFLFTQAKLFTGVESGKAAGQIYPFGFSAALLMLATAVPQCVLVFSGKNSQGMLPVGISMTAIVLAFYILTYLAAQWKNRMSAEKKWKESAMQAEAPVSEADKTEEGLLNCLEFLTEAYEGKEKFLQKADSPFFPRPMPESAKNPLN